MATSQKSKNIEKRSFLKV